MFKSLFAVFATLFAMNVAHATSLQPCTPIVEAQPSFITCRSGTDYVSIRIHVLMSDSRRCPYNQSVEYKTAQVEVSNASGAVTQKFEIGDGDFEYRLDSYFKSEKYGMDLKSCVSPINGGVSFGN